MNTPMLYVYQDKSGKWRWHAKRGNDRVIADSGQGYGRRSDAVRAAWATIEAMRFAVVRVLV